MELLMPKIKPKKPKKYTKKELNKIRKQTGACEHDLVSYKALESLNKKIMWRLKKDEKYLSTLSLNNYRLSRSLDRNTRLMDIWRKANEKNTKAINEREELWESRCEALTKVALDWRRKYEGLCNMKETAESMGIDTENYVATEEDKQFIKDYNFEHKATQLESGKVKNVFNFKKKNPEGHFYFGKWIPGKKKPKKPNGEDQS